MVELQREGLKFNPESDADPGRRPARHLVPPGQESLGGIGRKRHGIRQSCAGTDAALEKLTLAGLPEFRGCGAPGPTRLNGPLNLQSRPARRAPQPRRSLARGQPASARTIRGVHAQTHRYPHRPDHRRRTHRHRPGLRIRLFRRPGLQGAARGRLPGGAGQFQPRHHHDRSGHGGRHLYRTDHAGIRGKDHRPRAAQCAARQGLRPAAHHGRADRAQHRAVACARSARWSATMSN